MPPGRSNRVFRNNENIDAEEKTGYGLTNDLYYMVSR